MYSGTSYAGNPYAVGGSGYRASPVASAGPTGGSSNTNTSTSSSSSLSNPYAALGLGALAPVSVEGVARSASASSTGSGSDASSISSGSSTGSVGAGASYLMGASYGATTLSTAPLAPLTAPSTIAPLAVSSSLGSPASSVSDSSSASSSSLGSFYASPLLSSPLPSAGNSSSGASSISIAASPYCASAPPYTGADAGMGGAAGGAGAGSGGMMKNNAPASASSSSSGCGCGAKAAPPTNEQQPLLAGRRKACGRALSNNRSQIRVEVAETDLAPGEEEPTYHLKLDLNGRVYVAARTHAQLRTLVDTLQVKGYVLPRPFPEVRDVMAQAPVKVMAADDRLVQALPFYEGFGYSIKALASTVLRSSAAAGLRSRRRSFLVEQVTQRVEGFLKALFLENDDLQYEQEVYHFFWEPLEKKLQPVLEEGSDSEDEGAGPVKPAARPRSSQGQQQQEGGDTEGSSSEGEDVGEEEDEQDEELAARCAAALAVRA